MDRTSDADVPHRKCSHLLQHMCLALRETFRSVTFLSPKHLTFVLHHSTAKYWGRTSYRATGGDVLDKGIWHCQVRAEVTCTRTIRRLVTDTQTPAYREEQRQRERLWECKHFLSIGLLILLGHIHKHVHTNTHRAHICREDSLALSPRVTYVLVNSDTHCQYKQRRTEKPGHVPEMLVGSSSQFE